ALLPRTGTARCDAAPQQLRARSCCTSCRQHALAPLAQIAARHAFRHWVMMKAGQLWMALEVVRPQPCKQIILAELPAACPLGHERPRLRIIRFQAAIRPEN